MRCEVVAIGTELLLGQIVDTNSSWIGEQLALAGIDSHFQTKVGDNLARMVGCIRLALERSDAVILCGGLGPTQDDITREAIAEVMGVRLLPRPEIADHIRQLFDQRGRVMSVNNLRQAEVPEGAQVIPEMPGTAPGLICPVGDQVIYAVPGVPSEMRAMVGGSVLGDLKRRAGVPAVIRSRVLRTWGQSESGIAEMLGERIQELDGLGNPTLAFQASGIEGIKVRITAKAADRATAATLIADEEARVRRILGGIVFGTDQETMESAVLGLLQARGLTLATLETITGGLMAARLTAIPGAAAILRGSLTGGQPEVWHALLGVPPGPVVTPEAASALAEGVRKLFGADVGLAATGVLGPEEAEGRRPGTVMLGLSIQGHPQAEEIRLPGDRSRIREYGTISLLDFLRRQLVRPDAGVGTSGSR